LPLLPRLPVFLRPQEHWIRSSQGEVAQ
jgi:hypothetical protein